MKRFFLLLAAGFLFSSYSHAQYLLSGFEDWTGNDPQQWVTTNGLIALGNPQSVFKSSEPHSGNYAVEIKTIHVIKKVPGFPIPDYTASIYTGTSMGFNTIFGIPFTEKPKNMVCWYQYNARNNDSASVIVFTTRWNSGSGKRDTLAYAAGLITDSVGVYTPYTLALNYFDSLHAPDSVVVLFASSTTHTQAEGARLLLDDVTFTGGTVGLDRTIHSQSLPLYPNPCAGDVLYLGKDLPGTYTYAVYSMPGTLLRSGEKKQEGGLTAIPVQGLPQGVYLLQIQHEQKIYTQHFIIP